MNATGVGAVAGVALNVASAVGMAAGVYTVVLSPQAHRLLAQPFIVRLVAVIRRILLVLSGEQPVGTAELALLIELVAGFIAGLIAVSRFERSTGTGPPSGPLSKRPSGRSGSTPSGPPRRGGAG